MKKTLLPLAAAVLSLALTAGAAPIYMLQGDTFKTRVKLTEAAKTPGGALLLPGEYDLEVIAVNSADGVRAVFYELNGRKAGEASGKVVEKGHTTQAHGAGGGGGTGKAHFQDLHLTSQSPAKFTKQNQNLNLTIGGGETTHILIGLLLPAIQKVR